MTSAISYIVDMKSKFQIMLDIAFIELKKAEHDFGILTNLT